MAATAPVPNAAYVRIFLDRHTPLLIACRLIGAQLASGVYGSSKAAFPIYYVRGDRREEVVRNAIAAERPVPPYADPTDQYRCGISKIASEPIVVIGGHGWKHFVDQSDPTTRRSQDAADIFMASTFFRAAFQRGLCPPASVHRR
jgi:hypothetical protein